MARSVQYMLRCSHRQEFELEVHLVQLSGRPQPLGGPRQSQKSQRGISPQSPVPSQPHASVASGGITHLRKRRLPGGLFRRSSISPREFLKPVVTPVQNLECERLVGNENGSKPITQALCQSTTAIRAAFVPPLRRAAEETLMASKPVPSEMAWGLNAARALLLLACPCCGYTQCTQWWDTDAGTGRDTVDLFTMRFRAAENQKRPQVRHGEGRARMSPPMPGEIPTFASEGGAQADGLDELRAGGEYGRASLGMIAPSGGARVSRQPPSLGVNTAPPSWENAAGPAIPVEIATSDERRSCRSLALNGGAATAPNGHDGTAGVYAGGNQIAPSFSHGSRSRFVALAGGAPSRLSNAPADCASNIEAASQSGGFLRQRQAPARGHAPFHPPGAASVVMPSGTQCGTVHAAQGALKPGQQRQQLPLRLEPREYGRVQQFEPALGKETGPSAPPQPRPLLLAEELPQMQVTKLADLVPATFCTSPEGAVPFSVRQGKSGQHERP